MSQDNNTSTRRIISKVLNIENSAAWEVVSSSPEDHLYLVHHRPESDLIEHGSIRGIAVDTFTETVVAKSYGYAPTIVSNSLDQVLKEYPMNNMKITTGYEGTLINIFKHNGKIYRNTRKRLDPSRSRWGNSKTFMDMYWQLKGPTDEEMFDESTKYSPFCHTFIIVHPDVLVVSRENVGDGYLVYLGSKQLWSLDYKECPYKQTMEDGSMFPGVSQEEFDADPRPNAGWINPNPQVPNNIRMVKELTVEEANYHLKYGFHPVTECRDERLYPGEFVIITYTDIEGVEKQLRVESVAYNWRSKTRDNDPNLLHRFFELVSASYLEYSVPSTKDTYDSLFPTLDPLEESDIKSYLINANYITWPITNYNDPNYLMTKQSRMYNIWLAYLCVVPLHKQAEVSSYHTYLYAKRGELIKWIRTVEYKGFSSEVHSKRVINIIEASQKYARQKVKNGTNKNRTGEKLTVKDMIKYNIKNLVMKEQGASLYRLVKEMDKWKKDQQK